MDVGTKDLHVTFDITTGARSTIKAYEAPVATTLGTTMTPTNMNRTASTSAYCAVFYGGTINTTGTMIGQVFVAGSGERKSHIGGEVRNETEFIFKKSTRYSIQVANSITTTKGVGITAEWYY